MAMENVMQYIKEMGEERRERFRHEVRVNSLRVRKPTETDDVAYTEQDRVEWLAGVKGQKQ